MTMPEWLLYDGETFVASIHAESAEVARDLFKRAGLSGTHIRRAREGT